MCHVRPRNNGKGTKLQMKRGKNPRLVGLYFSEIGQKFGNLGLFSHVCGINTRKWGFFTVRLVLSMEYKYSSSGLLKPANNSPGPV